MTYLKWVLLLIVAILTCVASVSISIEVAEREATKHHDRVQRKGTRRQQDSIGDVVEYRRHAKTLGAYYGFAIWAISMPLGFAIGFVMGRGALRIGMPTVERGEAGKVFFIAQIFLIMLSLGIGRLLARFLGQTIAVGYAAAIAGIATDLLITIPLTFVVTLFTPDGQLKEIEVPTAIRVIFFCGTLTIALIAAVYASIVNRAQIAAEVVMDRQNKLDKHEKWETHFE